MPQAPVKGGRGRGRTQRSGPLAGAPGTRPVSGRVDHQGPSRRRRPGLPLPIVLTPGNVNDTTAFADVLNGVRTPRAGTGRPRTTPDRVLGDKAYSSRAIRPSSAEASGYRCHDPRAPRPGGQPSAPGRRGRRGGRPPALDTQIYRDRNVVGRYFARLKQFRAIATRFDKLANRYRAGVVLAALILWLREAAR
ncbi:transposase [Streptomyces globisporus]|uniref:transposase n=1 Tax=Streptomyces globisporus TaxID=1908 RepID=UPI003650A338